MKIITLRKVLLILFLLASLGYSMDEREQNQPTFVKVNFPAEQEKLKTEIAHGSSHIHIYIPNNSLSQPDQKGIDYPEDTLPDLKSIKALIIEHSLRSDRGCWKAAVAALVPIIKNAQNLEEITLSQALADNLLPHISKGINVLLDCSCAYGNNDTLYPKEYLMGIRNNLLKSYQEQYPTLQIDALEIQDHFALYHK